MRHADFVTLYTEHNVTNNSPVEILYQFVTTPFGLMIIAGDANGLCLCDFVIDPVAYTNLYRQLHPEMLFRQGDSSLLNKVKSFLLEPLTFNDYIPVKVNATDFQHAVWRSVLCIPWGDTSTYAQIAVDAGFPAAVRATGTALGKNPLLFVIPCHRVILSSGECGNYLRGREKKKSLLKYEQVHKGFE